MQWQSNPAISAFCHANLAISANFLPKLGSISVPAIRYVLACSISPFRIIPRRWCRCTYMRSLPSYQQQHAGATVGCLPGQPRQVGDIHKFLRSRQQVLILQYKNLWSRCHLAEVCKNESPWWMELILVCFMFKSNLIEDLNSNLGPSSFKISSLTHYLTMDMYQKNI